MKIEGFQVENKIEEKAEEQPEFSFLLVKPNAVKVGLTDVLRQELIEAGFEIIKEQKIHINRAAGEVFYGNLGEKKRPVINHIIAGESHIFVVYGKGAIHRLRELQGHTAWKDRPAKGLRGKYAVDYIQNSTHCPDGHKEVVDELNMVFPKIRDEVLRSQLADELNDFLHNKEMIEKGERYLSQYAI